MEQKHSGFGIASFILSLFVGAALLAVFVVAGVLQHSTKGEMAQNETATMIVGLAVILLLMADLLAVLLSIVGFFQADRKKAFAVLGFFVSGCTMAGTIGLVILGLMMKE